MHAKDPLILIAEAGARAVLVLSPEAGDIERHAAAELQHHLEQIAGARLIEDGANRNGDRPRVLLGRWAETERLLGDFDWSRLREDGVVLRRVGDDLVLAGATPRGTLYAVYELLQEKLNCRWLTPACSVLPRAQTVAFGELDHVPAHAAGAGRIHGRATALDACRDAVDVRLPSRMGEASGFARVSHVTPPAVPAR